MEDLKKRSTKGKGKNLSDKVKNANIKDWVDHKLHKAAFFESLKKKFVDSNEIPSTFGEYTNKGPFPDEFWNFEEGEHKKLGGNEAPKFDKYGDEILNQYLSRVRFK
jgi:hypothetical protein